ncbi:YihY/virulence factor BrkB family protein [Microbacterium sp. NPDC091313]
MPARTASSAPPDTHDDAPDSPPQLEKRSWAYVAKKTIREFSADQCTDLAAALTYYSVLALFPGALAVLSILGLVGQDRASLNAVLDALSSVAPDAAESVREPLEQIAGSSAAGFGLVLGLVLAIWSASGYVRAFTRAMNRIYEIREGRPFWKLVPWQLLITLIGVVLVCVAAAVLVVGGPIADALGAALGLGPAVVAVWSVARWLVLALIVVLMVAILYWATPNAKQPRFRWLSLGAVFAIVVLALASAGFGIYVANFSNYDRTYGSLAGVIVFLLWLWIANIALLLGAEFDAELERGRELQGGIAAERDIRLPPRDTRVSDKARAKEQSDEAEGRRIRESHD